MIASRPQQTVVAIDHRRVVDTAVNNGRVTDASGNIYNAATTRPPPRMPTGIHHLLISSSYSHFVHIPITF